MPLCQPQIRHELSSDYIWPLTARSWQQMVRAMAQPCFKESTEEISVALQSAKPSAVRIICLYVSCMGSTHRLGQEANICSYDPAYCTTRPDSGENIWVENVVFYLSFRSVHTLSHLFIVHFSVISHWQPEISGEYAAVGLERGPLNIVSTLEKLLGRNSSSSGIKIREYGNGDPLCWPSDTLYPQNLALTGWYSLLTD
jgi:hypothetical protein